MHGKPVFWGNLDGAGGVLVKVLHRDRTNRIHVCDYEGGLIRELPYGISEIRSPVTGDLQTLGCQLHGSVQLPKP